MKRSTLLTLGVFCVALLAAPGAFAAGGEPSGTAGSTEGRLVVPETLPEKPKEFHIGPREAIRIANSDPKVDGQRAQHRDLEVAAEAKPPFTWQVGYFAGDKEVAQVLVDDPTGQVRESWTGYQVAWQMARGYGGSFGHKLNAPYVWLPLAALFFFGLLEWRRPWRIVHLDLLVLLSFGISQIFFNEGNIGVSVPLAYPPLLYLLGRMLWVGFRGAGEGLRPSTPLVWLAIATAFLIGFRIALNVADSGVIDVGYSGVVGADHITHGQVIWGDTAFPTDNPTGDTYGPVNYLAYVPFELIFPWSGSWDDLPAAHAAAIFFDLAVIALLYVLGRRLDRRRRREDGSEGGASWRELSPTGTVLAFAWVAYPYTDYVLQSNSNDSLVAVFVLAALLVITSAPARGAMSALAGLTKFAPFALAPLFAAGPRAGLASTDPETGDKPLSRSRLRALALFALGLAGAAVVLMAWPVIDPGISTFWHRTISSQIDRDSPFSIWGQEQSLGWLQHVVQGLAILLAILVAFLPRRRTLPQIAALAAAILIATQLTADHWFYLYIVWFLPTMIVSLSLCTPNSERG